MIFFATERTRVPAHGAGRDFEIFSKVSVFSVAFPLFRRLLFPKP